MKSVNFSDVSQALDISRQAAMNRAARENWKHVCEKVQGGHEKRFPVRYLPEDVRLSLARTSAAVVLSAASPGAAAGAATGAELSRAKSEDAEKTRIQAETRLAEFAMLETEKQEVAYARREVLQAWEHFLIASAAANKKKGSGLFCHLYNNGEIRIADHIRGRVKKLSWATLNRWQNAYAERGILGLATNHHNPKKGSTALSDEQRNFVLGMLVEYPHSKFSTIEMAMETRFAEKPGSGVLRRFVNGWRQDNESLILYITNPDKWRNTYQFAVGDASEQVVRLNQVWEFDSTPADIILADGRHCLIGVIDVYSRRLKLQVSKTSRATAVAALTRRAIMDWGVPEIAKTDNGSDYVSRHMVQVFSGLGIEQRLCPPFTPEAKPHIERSFKTFAHSFQELMPGYIGHSVADRKDIEARRSFATRLMDRDDLVEITMTAEELQSYCNRWCEAMYHQHKHRGLNNRTPAEVARAWKDSVRAISNERALDILLAEAPSNNGVRTVGKDGVQVGTIFYISEYLPEVGSQVRVKLDATDLGTVYLFDVDGEFICVAQDPLRTGIDRAETASKVKNRQNKLIKEGKKALIKNAKAQALSEIHEEILGYKESQIANIIELPKRTVDYSTTALDEAGKAASAMDDLQRKGAGFDDLILSLEEEKAITAAIPKKEKIVLLISESDRYDQIRSRVKKEKRQLSRQEYDFLNGYYQTVSGRTYMALEGDLREKYGLAESVQAEA